MNIEALNYLEHIITDGGIKKLYISDQSVLALAKHNFSSGYRLAIPLDGCHRMKIPLNGKIETIYPKRYSATFMPKNSWNLPDWELPVKVVTLLFNDDGFICNYVNTQGGYDHSKLSQKSIYWSGLEGHTVLNLLKASPKHDLQKPYIHLVNALLFYCLNSSSNQLENKSSSKAENTFKNIYLYLEENYSLVNSREDVATNFKLTPNYISHLFKSQTGMSFSHHLTTIRINQACYLLKKFNQNIDEIARVCGYHETSYFCRVFKKIKGHTPSAYRLKHSVRSY
ncbi:transcriptional regulator [Lentisphaera araneosa HTCC2155]|uniref:Transcriptional regulator n=1 Tax=Lentisphaera araneosa HTCC2155 TaxID=313628 RepID=A6DLX0_9BACT|nr:AraC family transcriptional regulator [Lentisphaera araneosa]EDM27268.1 transcriptional regulator [Lentisphaera araneosa HTCC2155]